MVDLRRLADALWTGRNSGAQTARMLLSPFELVYRSVIEVRQRLYDAGVFNVESFSVPVVSVGNLSVGGTGKTPVAAWVANRFAQKGVKAGIVLRGYGGDETLVHQRLNPEVPVVASADRSRGVREAIAQGIDVVILDDAFQHRRAARNVDILLIDADAWTGSVRLIPNGPWREPLRSARRASIVFITRKTADASAVEDARRAVAATAPRIPIATVTLAVAELHSTATGQTLPLHVLRGVDLTAIAGVARPEPFFRQLTELGAVVRPHAFPDHYAYTRRDAQDLAAQAGSSDFVVCTLKDAVKLAALWPPEAGSLWYVSQRLRIDSGLPEIDRILDNLLASAG